MNAGFPAAVFVLLIIVAGVGDALTRRIPHLLLIILAVSFFPLAYAYGMSWPQVGLHALAGFAMLMAAYILFSVGILGGGDAKLLAVVALWSGPSGAPEFLLMTAISGAFLALVIGIWSLMGFEAEIRSLPGRLRLTWIRPSLPYGVAIAAGAIIAAPATWWAPVVPFWSLLTTH